MPRNAVPAAVNVNSGPTVSVESLSTSVTVNTTSLVGVAPPRAVPGIVTVWLGANSSPAPTNVTAYATPLIATSNVAPVPVKFCPLLILAYSVESTAVPVAVCVSISPPVSTVLIVIVQSLAGLVPPSAVPATVRVSFSAYPDPIFCTIASYTVPSAFILSCAPTPPEPVVNAGFVYEFCELAAVPVTLYDVG